MTAALDRACQALIALTAAGEERVDGASAEQTADLVDLASDDLAELIGTVEGLAALLDLFNIAVNFGAQIAGESPSFVARFVCDVAQQADRED